MVYNGPENIPDGLFVATGLNGDAERELKNEIHKNAGVRQRLHIRKQVRGARG